MQIYSFLGCTDTTFQKNRPLQKFKLHIMKRVFEIASFLLFFNVVNAQPTDNLMLERFEGNEIKWLGESNDIAFYAVMDKKTKKWGVFSATDLGTDEYETKQIVKPMFDSIGDFDRADFTIVERGGKYGVLYMPTVADIENFSTVKFLYSDAQIKYNSGIACLVVKQNGRWGQIDAYENFEITGFFYDSADDVPVMAVDSWSAALIKTARKELRADIVEMDKGNGDGVFRARNSQTKQWGMFQSIGKNNFIEMIPMQFDSLRFFNWNGSFTAVYKDGKVGFYLSKWSYDENATLSVACKYDDYQRFSADGVSKLACKRDGKWGWVNWLTGEEESEFYAETSDDLQYPYYHQATWFE